MLQKIDVGCTRPLPLSPPKKNMAAANYLATKLHTWQYSWHKVGMLCAVDVELVYNAIIALVMVQPFHSGEVLINELCDKLGGQPGEKQNALRLRL